MAGPAGRVLIYGGKGALGSVCVQYFKAQNWWVGNIDFVSNDEANANIVLEGGDSWTSQGEVVGQKVADMLADQRLNAIICVAGGWAGGNAADKDFIQSCDLMWKQSVWTSCLAAQLAAKHLTDTGTLVLTGAQPALKGTAGMIGYGMAKGAVHHLVQSLALKKGGLPEGACVAAILPVTLDTPNNRKFMPKADHSKWTPLETVAELFHKWSVGEDRPTRGALVQLLTKEGKTEFVPA